VFEDAGSRVAATIAGAASKAKKLVKCILKDGCLTKMSIERLRIA
jgi:hypothetical protein